MQYKTRELQDSFTFKLKKITKEKNITQKELCKKLELGQSTVSNWYQGKAMPKQDKLNALSNLLGVDANYWLPDSWNNDADEKNYYIDPETRELAEKMRTDKNLKLLFSEAADATPEDLKATYLMLKALKDKEQNTGD